SVPAPVLRPARASSRPPAQTLPPEERAALVAGNRFDGAEVAVDVLLVELDTKEQVAIGKALVALGCRVTAFTAAEKAEAHVRETGFEVLVAGPATLARSGNRLLALAGSRALGAIAVMDRAGVDKSIEAIHLGARGVLSPPYEERRVALEFRRAVGRLLEESGRLVEPG
ncbi:MAG TPA: hypothetical protein VM285_07305, partial [Polyangia bacterium]|nr:hypothetical protein [Polyangia bacterium]